MAWIEQHCVVPEGDLAGSPFVPTLAHRVYLANWYEVRPTAQLGEKNVAFRYRTAQWMAAQKVGKSPGVAAEACLEFVGPALFDGWAIEGDFYDCSVWGCPCGWLYFYEVGEPKGKHWPTPRIQLAAVVEDQVENTWGALVPMIDDGPLANVIPKTGEAFIRHPSGNRDARIEIVTSKADGKLGARIVRGFCDETGLWTDSNHMKKFMRTLARGANAMGGRVSESTNPFDPAENSQAQDTYESKQKDVYKHHFPPPAALKFELKKDREQIFRWNYLHSPWVDIRAIESDAASLMEANAGEAERFYGNRIVPGSGHWIKQEQWEAKKSPAVVTPRTKVTLGFDGSDNNDWTGIRLETMDYYQFTPTYEVGGERRPTLWMPDPANQMRIPRSEVNAAMDQLANEFEIVRAYCDPHLWETEIDAWGMKHGEKVFLKWPTNSIGRMHASLERFRTDITNPDSQFRHDGDEQTGFHMRNAIMRARPGQKYILGKPAEHQKIDQVMSSALAHEAACDALAAGEFETSKSHAIYF
jgi:hypothetical protein